MFARILTFVMLYTTHQKFAICLIPPFDSHIGWILLKGFSIWLLWQLLVPGKEPAAIKFEQLGWESLSDRRWFHRLVQFFKIQNGFTPTYLTTPVPQCPRNHLFGTRNENDLHSIKCRTNAYLHSFYLHSVKIWNEIGPTRVSLNLMFSNIFVLKRRMFSIFMTLKARKDYFGYVLD